MAQPPQPRPVSLLHPMTVADLLDDSFRLMRNNARVVFATSAVFIGPTQLLTFAISVRSGAPEEFGFGGSVFRGFIATGSGSADDVVFGVVAVLLSLLSVALIGGAVCQVALAHYGGDEVSTRSVLRGVRHKALALMGAWFLVHVLEASGALVFGVLGIGAYAGGGDTLGGVLLLVGVGLLFPIGFVVMPLSVAVSPCVVIEDLGPVESLRRSWRLMRRRFWPVAGIALLAGFIGSMVAWVLSIIPLAIGFGLGGLGGWVVITLSSIMVLLVTQPFVAFVASLQYLDGRIRTEGLDLAIVADRLLAEES
ncbi:MAG: hypothetical protein ACSLFB_08790 [Acidimicrobiales bacterium]